MNSATKLSRKMRKRLEARTERVLRQSDRDLEHKGLVTLPIAVVESLQTMQRFFCGIVKEQGRVRVSKATLESLRDGDSVKRAVLPDGAVMLTFNAGDAPEQGSEG